MKAVIDRKHGRGVSMTGIWRFFIIMSWVMCILS